MGCGGSKATSAAGTDPESAPAGAGIRRPQNLGAEKENGGADHDCVNASVCANDRDTKPPPLSLSLLHLLHLILPAPRTKKSLSMREARAALVNHIHRWSSFKVQLNSTSGERL